MALRLSVCLSVCHKSELYRNGQTNQANFGTRTSLHGAPSTLYYNKNSGSSKSKDTSLWNCIPNSGRRKFHDSPSIVATCRQLSSTKVDAQYDKQ